MKGKLLLIVLALAAVAYISAAYAQQNSSTLNLVSVQNNLAADANKAPGQEPNQEPNQAPDKGKKPGKTNLCSADLKKDADANKPAEPNKPTEPNKATVIRLSDFRTYADKPKGGEKEPNSVEPNKPKEPNKADLCSADLKKDADSGKARDVNKPVEPNKPSEPNDKK